MANSYSGGVANAFVQGFNKAYDTTEDRREGRESRAVKAKQDAALYEQDIKTKAAQATQAQIKTDSMKELYGQATNQGNIDDTVSKLQQKISDQDKAIAKMSANNMKPKIIEQVIAPDSRANLGAFNSYKNSDPVMSNLFGKEDVRMPSKDSFEDRRAMYAHIALQGGKPTPETADRLMDSGLYYMGQNGKIVDATAIMSVTGAFKSMTPEQKVEYEKLIEQTFNETDGPDITKLPLEDSTEAAPNELATMASSIKSAESTDKETDTQTRVNEATADADKAANTIPVELTRPTNEAESKVEQLALTPPSKQADTELLRALAGIRAEPSDKAKSKTAMEVKIDLATELTGERIEDESLTDYQKRFMTNFRDVSRADDSPSTSGSGGKTAATRTLEEWASIMSDPNTNPTTKKLVAAKIAALDPNKLTATMRNILFKEDRGLSAVAGEPMVSSNPTGTGTMYDVTKLGGLPTKVETPKVTKSGITVQEAKEENTFNQYGDKADVKAVKEIATTLPRRAKTISELVKFKVEVAKLYKKGKMDAGYADDFFQYLGTKVPLAADGTVDQEVANAKIRSFVYKQVKENSGANASNIDVQNVVDNIMGPVGSQEPIKQALLNQYIDDTVEQYNTDRNYAKTNKQHTLVRQADDVVNKNKKPTGKSYQIPNGPLLKEGQKVKDSKGTIWQNSGGKLVKVGN